MKQKPDVFYIPNSLSIQRVKSREGPAITFVVWSGNSSRIFQDKKEALKFIQWLKSTPTGALIREWFDQFEEDGKLPELDTEQIKKEGFDPKHIQTRKIRLPRLRWSHNRAELDGFVDSRACPIFMARR